MTTADEWRDLARRCREATKRYGGDREIDAAIFRMDDGRSGLTKNGWKRWWPDSKRWGHLEMLTHSVDAIGFRIEKTMPGKDWSASKNGEKGVGQIDGQCPEVAASPALALCAAYCEARVNGAAAERSGE